MQGLSPAGAWWDPLLLLAATHCFSTASGTLYASGWVHCEVWVVPCCLPRERGDSLVIGQNSAVTQICLGPILESRGLISLTFYILYSQTRSGSRRNSQYRGSKSRQQPQRVLAPSSSPLAQPMNASYRAPWRQARRSGCRLWPIVTLRNGQVFTLHARPARSLVTRSGGLSGGRHPVPE